MKRFKLQFTTLDGKFGVCRLQNDAEIPLWAYKGEFFSISKTRDELSIVCSLENIPSDIKCEKDWRIIKVLGVLDFSLTGILAGISKTLADAGISIFAISTFDTDYILVKEIDYINAVNALKADGHEFQTS